SIDCYARANGLNPMPRADIPRARDVFLSADALPAFGPLLLLAWMLFTGYTPTLAGGAATLLMVALAVLCRVALCLQQKRAQDIGRELGELGAKIWEGLIDGGKGVI